jgi:hypothetical protein
LDNVGGGREGGGEGIRRRRKRGQSSVDNWDL